MLGRAARDGAVAVDGFGSRRAARLRGARTDRPLGHDPRVLAAAGSLGHGRSLAIGDARESAGHQGVVAVAVGDGEHPQHDGAALEAAGVPDRRVGQGHRFLDDPGFTVAALPLEIEQAGAIPEADRFGREIRERRGHDAGGQAPACLLDRRPVIAPPRADRRGRQRLPEQVFAGGGQIWAQGRRFEHARAEGVGHKDAAARQAGQAGTPSAESERGSSGSRSRRSVAEDAVHLAQARDRFQEDAT